MAHYRLLDRLPSAIVTAGGSEKKVYKGNDIFFNKGDNFELRFFNPLQEKIGVEIIFNGQKKSDGLLVVNPGEDIKLDRFLDDTKKMVFDTYHIDSNNYAAVAAAELNGDVIINFFKEKYVNHYYSQSGGGLPHFSSTNSNSRMYDSKNIPIQKDYWMPSCEGEVNLDSFTSDEVDFGDYLAESTSSLTETGRVEKGDESTQNLNLVDIEFDSTPFHSVHYNLKPTSTRGYTRTTEIRNYCDQCSYRVRKQNWKYCPKCGNKLF